MEVIFTVRYYKKVFTEDLPKLSKANKKRVQKSIEEKLTTQPHIFGEPLRHSLRGYKKLRIGDHRIVFYIEKKTVIIVCIEHRSSVYVRAGSRL